jgi:hypothetical protein
MTSPQNLAVASRRNRWHQSTLSSLLDGCSWQYFLTYIVGLDQGLKPHASVGTAYHSAVEVAERARMNGDAPLELKQILELAHGFLDEVTKDTELHTRLTACVQNYWKHIKPYLEQFEPIALEPEFTINLVEGAMPVGGYIDGVYRDPRDGQIFVIDHKTVGNFSRWRDADGHRHQAAMYSAALVMSEDFPEITYMPEMRYLLVRTSVGTRANFEPFRILDVQPDLEDVRVLGERVRMAEHKVATKDFSKNMNWPLCSEMWCPFYEGCVRTGELSGTIESVMSINVGHTVTQSSTGTNHEGDSNV